jgi:hypothetical protein
MSKDRNEPVNKAEEHLLRQPDHVRELEALLRSGKLVLGGFMGWDDRELYELIEEDLRAVWGKGHTVAELAARMAELTKTGIAGLGNPVESGGFQITVEENKGLNVCPWNCQDHLSKRVTTINRTKDGKSLRWADLGIHMILRHGFFEGQGSLYRLEPIELIEMIFDKP